jgi:hypothetical protein
LATLVETILNPPDKTNVVDFAARLSITPRSSMVDSAGVRQRSGHVAKVATWGKARPGRGGDCTLAWPYEAAGAVNAHVRFVMNTAGAETARLFMTRSRRGALKIFAVNPSPVVSDQFATGLPLRLTTLA